MGMAHGDIPAMLGRVLSGTKYGVKQTRGKFGLGAKMALIWSKMSTGLPVEILSAPRGQSFVSYYKLDIDIHKCASVSVCRNKGAGPQASTEAQIRGKVARQPYRRHAISRPYVAESLINLTSVLL